MWSPRSNPNLEAELKNLKKLPTDSFHRIEKPLDFDCGIPLDRRAFVAADTAKWVSLHETGLQLGRPDFVQKDFDVIWRRCHSTRYKEEQEPNCKTWRRTEGEEDGPQTIGEVKMDDFEPLPQISIDPLEILGETLDTALPMHHQIGSPSWERPFREVVLSDQSEEVFVWMFWLVFIVAFRKDQEIEDSWESWDSVLERVRQGVSKRFANLSVLTALPPGKGPRQGAADILRRYPLVLAEAISAGFRREFPESSEVRRNEFAEICHRRVSQEINGFAYHSITIDGFRTTGFKGHGSSQSKASGRSGGDGTSGIRKGTPPTCMSTTQLSPFFQRQCKKSQIFTVRDPGHKVRFQTPNSLIGHSCSMPALQSKKQKMSKEYSGGVASGELGAGSIAAAKIAAGKLAHRHSKESLPFLVKGRETRDPEHDALQLIEHHNRLISKFMNGRPRVVLAEKYEAKRRAKERNAFRPPSLQRRGVDVIQ